MPSFFFHCTDGVDTVLDRLGTELSDDEDLRPLAFGSALQLMRSLPSYGEWADWIVAVYDEGGFQVQTVAFPNVRIAESDSAPAIRRAHRERSPTIPRQPTRLSRAKGERGWAAVNALHKLHKPITTSPVVRASMRHDRDTPVR